MLRGLVMGGAVSSRGEPTRLHFAAAGGAELLDAEGATVWASDSDEDFRGRFPDFLTQEEVEDVLDYLVDRHYLTDSLADELEVTAESEEQA